MSLHAQPIAPIPEETVRVAQAAFPRGNVYMRLRDTLGTIYNDQAFAALFPRVGQPAEPPWRLALVSVLQFAEGLSDRQAADAVRSRIDWKYLLGLELTDSGFDSSVLCEFRSRLIAGGAEEQVLETLLELCREQNLLKARGRQRTDSTHVLAAVRAVNRLECVGEAMRAALNELATRNPEWLLNHFGPLLPQWSLRYAPRVEEYRLPTGQAERQELAETIGRDGLLLMETAWAPESSETPEEVHAAPALQVLRRIWVQQYYVQEDQQEDQQEDPQGGDEPTTRPSLKPPAPRWRTEKEGLPPASLSISSPYDTQAHYGKKRSTAWLGYKVHLSQTCDDETPHLITHVETTTAPVDDGEVIPQIHQALQRKNLLPSTHLADAGYVYTSWLVQSPQKYGVDLVGPVRQDRHWQAQQNQGFAAADFQVNWSSHQVTCPQGRVSRGWSAFEDKNHNAFIKIQFSRAQCGHCAVKTACTRSPSRSLSILPQPEYEALRAAREREDTSQYRELYAKRAGIEGAVSQSVRAFGMRKTRYFGLAKTHLQHILTAVAIDLIQLDHWLCQLIPTRTRTAPLKQLLNPA